MRSRGESVSELASRKEKSRKGLKDEIGKRREENGRGKGLRNRKD